MPKWVLGGTVAGVLSAGALLLVGNVQGQVRAQQAGFLPYLDKEAVAAGGELYTEYCASCHGASLAGEANWRQRDSEGYLPAPPHDATGHTWHHPDAQLFMTTKFGTEAMVGNGYRSRMMGFEDVLSDREIVQILAFIKSTWPERIIEAHNQRNAAVQNQ